MNQQPQQGALSLTDEQRQLLGRWMPLIRANVPSTQPFFPTQPPTLFLQQQHPPPPATYVIPVYLYNVVSSVIIANHIQMSGMQYQVLNLDELFAHPVLRSTGFTVIHLILLAELELRHALLVLALEEQLRRNDPVLLLLLKLIAITLSGNNNFSNAIQHEAVPVAWVLPPPQPQQQQPQLQVPIVPPPQIFPQQHQQQAPQRPHDPAEDDGLELPPEDRSDNSPPAAAAAAPQEGSSNSSSIESSIQSSSQHRQSSREDGESLSSSRNRTQRPQRRLTQQGQLIVKRISRRVYRHDTFVYRLHRLLTEMENNGLDYIASFTAGGEGGLILYDPKLFEREIMPYYFKGRKLRTLRRQLISFGFVRELDEDDEDDDGTTNTGAGRYIYKNPFFVRGFPELLDNVVRDDLHDV